LRPNFSQPFPVLSPKRTGMSAENSAEAALIRDLLETPTLSVLLATSLTRFRE
jgi:hypothetical protein